MKIKVDADTTDAVESMRRLEVASKRAAQAQRSGWQSTKLHLALIVMALLTLVYGLAGFPMMAFGEYCLGIISAAGIYSGSRVAESFAQRPPPPNP